MGKKNKEAEIKAKKKQILSIILSFFINHWVYLINFKRDKGKFFTLLIINVLVITISVVSFVGFWIFTVDFEEAVIVLLIVIPIILLTNLATKIFVVIERFMKPKTHFIYPDNEE